MSEVNSLDHLQRLAAAYNSNPVLRLHFKTEAVRTVTKQGGDRSQVKEDNSCKFCYSRGPIKPKSNGRKPPKITAQCCLCGKPFGLKSLVQGPKKSQIAPEVARTIVPAPEGN